MSTDKHNQDRPNVLLVVLDTARADTLAPYCADRNTPTVAQLAARGAAYPQAIAPSCWTVPSHAAMLMGDPPRSVGICRVMHGNLCEPVIQQQRDRLLPEILRRNGYQTRGVSTNTWISSANGFSIGFDEFRDVSGTRYTQMSKSGFRPKLNWYLDALRARADDGAHAVEELLDGWLGATTRGPFFWFVNLIECHSPYLPPKPFGDLGPLGRLAAARDSARHLTLNGVLRAIATGDVPPDRALRRMRHLYDRSVELMDRWLARVLDALDRRNLLDETIVVVTSDHGENFGECGLLGHGGSLDDRLLRVPLVIAGPRVEAVPDTAVGLDALPRIIAELIGIDHPWQDRWPEGVAVAQYDGPVKLDDPRAEFICRLEPPPDRLRRLTERFTCATDGQRKLVRGAGETVLYDLETDPLETKSTPVEGRPSPEVSRLSRALDQAQEEEHDMTTEGGAGEMTEDLEDRMRLLGYL